MSSYNILMQKLIINKFKTLGIAYSPYDISKYENFLLLMQKWNKVFNLTSIVDLDDMIHRHLVESLAFVPHLSGTAVADIGSGAGIPGVPLAISNPDKHFTLIESRAKRARFLRHVVGELKLKNITVKETRVEKMSLSEAFDVAVVKAVIDPSKLFGLVEHLLSDNGIILVLTNESFLDNNIYEEQKFKFIPISDFLVKNIKGSLIRIERKVYKGVR